MASLGWDLIWHDRCFYKKILGHRQHKEAHSCEVTMRKWPFASQGERPLKKTSLLTPWSWTSSSGIMRKSISVFSVTKSMAFCCGSPSKLVECPFLLFVSLLWGNPAAILWAVPWRGPCGKKHVLWPTACEYLKLANSQVQGLGINSQLQGLQLESWEDCDPG